jgi:hypothetical protein
MYKYRKVLIGIFSLILVFILSFCYGYRNNLKNDVAMLYKNYLGVVYGYNDKPNVKAVSGNIIKDSSKDETIIKKDVPVLYVDIKHYVTNGKDKVVEDTTKHSSSDVEGFAGKKVKDIYEKLKKRGYDLKANVDAMLCVKKYTPGKYVAKINGAKYEVFQANNDGELYLVESGGNINHKGEDEAIFNKNTEEFSTLEEAKESLSDFTS